MSLARSQTSALFCAKRRSVVAASQAVAGRPDVRQAQAQLGGAVPLRATEFSPGSDANLRLAQTWDPSVRSAHQRFAELSRYRALCHLMPCVHKVKILAVAVG